MKKGIVCWCLYLVLVTCNSAALLAYLQGEYPSLATKDYRKDLATAVGIRLIPVVSWVMTPFLTGFYEHGFCLTRSQCQQRAKEAAK
jgi:hypothetical protein